MTAFWVVTIFGDPPSLRVFFMMFVWPAPRISDPAPEAPGMEHRRNRGVRCIRGVGPAHLSLGNAT